MLGVDVWSKASARRQRDSLIDFTSFDKCMSCAYLPDSVVLLFFLASLNVTNPSICLVTLEIILIKLYFGLVFIWCLKTDVSYFYVCSLRFCSSIQPKSMCLQIRDTV